MDDIAIIQQVAEANGWKQTHHEQNVPEEGPYIHRGVKVWGEDNVSATDTFVFRRGYRELVIHFDYRFRGDRRGATVPVFWKEWELWADGNHEVSSYLSSVASARTLEYGREEYAHSDTWLLGSIIRILTWDYDDWTPGNVPDGWDG
ncbi:hypothetical protein J4U01_gp090 [Mycobacterium phage Kumao]|uniref:Uncharacterized protein n=1 Tax=Mycobacterium phage Kumao TaxID=2041344 RepID=A0A2D1GQ31_9CAUD|nr:hypothetical protein J4U01_gp090 [Mycobacterium phage Kumao]ATN94068.1 hypothetical protein SEA_KUMAO_106 [Mycobacterium phage Kumao]